MIVVKFIQIVRLWIYHFQADPVTAADAGGDRPATGERAVQVPTAGPATTDGATDPGQTGRPAHPTHRRPSPGTAETLTKVSLKILEYKKRLF